MKRIVKSIEETFEDNDVEQSVQGMQAFFISVKTEFTKEDEEHYRTHYSDLNQKRAECRAAGKHLKLNNLGYIATSHGKLTDTVREHCYHCEASYERRLNENERQSILAMPKLLRRKITL